MQPAILARWRTGVGTAADRRSGRSYLARARPRGACSTPPSACRNASARFAQRRPAAVRVLARERACSCMCVCQLSTVGVTRARSYPPVFTSPFSHPTIITLRHRRFLARFRPIGTCLPTSSKTSAVVQGNLKRYDRPFSNCPAQLHNIQKRAKSCIEYLRAYAELRSPLPGFPGAVRTDLSVGRECPLL